ncbi:unnamed protein product [Protopolystoma xenopodis]|uniref:Uncharacterized protein n=1 Tax=Protopolystoma xenopodis TaxID=117903 RepID=A0A448XE03_9PLAT|nr:unnamed protein product [Protopolystoma xenopodis]
MAVWLEPSHNRVLPLLLYYSPLNDHQDDFSVLVNSGRGVGPLVDFRRIFSLKLNFTKGFDVQTIIMKAPLSQFGL